MQQRPLGRSALSVSALCLGTMTWGEQNNEADAHAQIDLALDCGINFLDLAEMYPVPPRAATQGETERCFGSWLAAHPASRDRIILATKVAGPDRGGMAHIRGGKSRLDRANITQALDASLTRLRTDYIDLYQLHWPDRPTNMFGKLGYSHVEQDSVPLEETLDALDDLVRAGKIRTIGVSNETPWGVMRLLTLAEQRGGTRIVSIQNPYSLLNRSFEIGLAEVAIREACGLLAYSPLGMGVLTGKYRHGARPAKARLTLYERFTRYSNPQAQRATEAYLAIADQHGVDPAMMALAYVTSRPFVTATILGATTLEQLRHDIASAALTLSDETLQAIEAVHSDQPNPSP